MTASSSLTLSVLIVDDEPLARVRLRDLLADIAGEVPNEVVAEASNGVVAVELLKERRPDVMLVDIRMPKMDGIELARHVGRLENPPAIIFVTAYDSYAVQASNSTPSTIWSSRYGPSVSQRRCRRSTVSVSGPRRNRSWQNCSKGREPIFPAASGAACC